MNSSAAPDGRNVEAVTAGSAPPRILLVDDDPVNQMVALGLLRRRGWEAAAAPDGNEALRVLAGQRFDLILMDLQMPQLDGYQTAFLIRQREAQTSSTPGARRTTETVRGKAGSQARRIPIIALTTASQQGVREKCLAAGMDDFLNKPVSPRDLYAIIEKYLGDSRTA